MSYSGSLEEALGALHFDYPAIIESLTTNAQVTLTPHEQALLGVSLFRWARLEEAQGHLERAAATLPEGSSAQSEVLFELCAVRLAALDADGAEVILAQIPPTSSPWLGNLLLRRQAGVSIARGDVIRACALFEQAWQGFVAADLPRGKVITAFYLGATLAYRGEFRRAESFFEQTISYARQANQPALLFDALAKRMLALVYAGDLLAAQLVLDEMQSLSSIRTPSLPPFMTAVTLMNEIVLARARGQKVRFLLKLAQLAGVSRERPHPELIYWLGPLVLDSLSRIGRHEQARQLLDQSMPPGLHRPLPVRVVEAVILTRSGAHQRAAELLGDLVGEAHEAGLRIDLTRAQLHLAHALFKSQQHLKVAGPLIQGLQGVAALGLNFLFKDDLVTLRPVLRWGQRQDQVRPYLELLKGAAQEGDHLVLQSFGGFQALLNGQSLHFRLDGQELLLLVAYLHKHPNCTYAELASQVFSEKAPQAGLNYARQAVMLLRQQFGEDRVLTLRDRPNQAARVRLEGLRVTYDVDSLFEAVEQCDSERIFALYQGRFAPHSTSRYAAHLAPLIEGGVLKVLEGQLRRARTAADFKTLIGYLDRFRAVADDNEELRDFSLYVHSLTTTNFPFEPGPHQPVIGRSP